MNFAHPTFAIAKIRDYSQSSCDMNFEYFIDPGWYPASRVALDLEKSDEDYSITKRLFIHLITFYFHSVRSVLASFSLLCSWQGKVNVHQSAVKTK